MGRSTLGPALHPDNKVDTLAYDGALVCRDAFGNPTAIQLPDSPPPATVEAVLQGDGTWLATRTNGEFHRYAADGTLTAMGQSTSWWEDYDAEGHRIAWHNADGSYDRYDLQGRVIEHGDPAGNVTTTTYAQDGTHTLTFSDGHTEVFRADNSRACVTWNGVTTDYASDGNTPVHVTTISGLAVTFATDGTRTIDLPNAWCIVVSADGSTLNALDTLNQDAPVACATDGSHQNFWLGSPATMRVNGDYSTETLDLRGFTVQRTRPDGSTDTFQADGAEVTRNAAGTVTGIRFPDVGGPQSASHESDGTFHVTLSNGETRTWSSEARLTQATFVGGAQDVYTWAPDGGHSVSRRDATGVEFQRVGYDAQGQLTWTRVPGSEGTYTVTLASGEVDSYRADDTLSQKHLPTGEIDLYEADGVRLSLVHLPDGTHDVYAWAQDGSRTVSHTDASGVELTLTAYNAAGEVLSTRADHSDGSFTVTFPSGQVEEFRADGTLATRSPLAETSITLRWTDASRASTSPTAPLWLQPGPRTAATPRPRRALPARS